MNKKYVTILVIVLTLVISNFIVQSVTDSVNDGSEATKNTDWWFMFQHDLQHTGSSTSHAPETNNLKWTYLTNDIISSSSPIIVNNKVYIGSRDKKVYCLDAEGCWNGTTNVIWSYTTGGTINSTPAFADGRIYIGSNDKKVYCLDANGNGDGTTNVIWTFEDSFGFESSPAVNDGKVYIASKSKYVYCLDSLGNNDGTTNRIWSYETGDIITSSPAIFNGKLYIGSKDKKIYCLDANGNGDGTTNLIWSYTTGGAISSSPAIVNGKLYIGSNDKKIYCLDANGNGDGTTNLIWSYTTGGAISSSPAVASEKVYIGSQDRKVYCLDANGNGDGTTNLIWSYATGGVISSSPAVASEKVYIGTQLKQILCFDANGNGDGTTNLIWSYTTGGAISSSPAIVNGKLYIGSNDKKLYCFETPRPSQPIISGNHDWKPNQIVFIEVRSTDSDNRPIRYGINWTGQDITWSSYYPSNTTQIFTHVYTTWGVYTVAVIAENNVGAKSPWSYHTIYVNNSKPTDPVVTGPTEGWLYISYNFTAESTDDDGESLYYYWDWNNDGIWEDYGPSVSHAWTQPGMRTFKVWAYDGQEFSNKTTSSILIRNHIPEKPTLTGPTEGITGVSYTFFVNTTDEDGNYVKYGFDWNGDDQIDQWTVTSVDPTVPYPVPHIFTEPGTYTIKAKAKDEWNTSDWSNTLIITIKTPANLSVIKIGGGGLFGQGIFNNIGIKRIQATIVNTGQTSAYNVTWNITLSGGNTGAYIFAGEFAQGFIPQIEGEQSVIIIDKPVRGIGTVDIIITIKAELMPDIVVTKKARLFFGLIFVQ
ncbi:MAG: PQQ-binding-like beta-propeller repeat protein [Candidatus Thermoplasmatota archaeon]